ncbi:MAG: hypothetical protein B7Y26_13505 [Hydrogenophilales bacterium 16-64-46]|nr:MAG: hypothetical protein B7Z32_13485 [Hydrogenophilales bacterium 12-64-13]OYZ04025.1 MAG: hypothetical protein B7Y26_13505 [Hydrogenophilales bacterium 16-64-46]OZA36663.1 MAG: hypothetical protein B7X87_13655 [Hydrogenophilales bacterium 17-64-34]
MRTDDDQQAFEQGVETLSAAAGWAMWLGTVRGHGDIDAQLAAWKLHTLVKTWHQAPDPRGLGGGGAQRQTPAEAGVDHPARPPQAGVPTRSQATMMG